ncbi:AI-2E family transporter [Desulfococcus sp.]|uniref:AI-2E family transporter n=1 Tax=Desulfococcus sp. TaxID=2025834 RepID=UPI0035943ECC
MHHNQNLHLIGQDQVQSFSYPWNIIVPAATRILVWGMLAAILYILRSFFLLIFLTFVFAYIQRSGGNHLAKYIKNRALRVTLVAAIFLNVLVAVGIFLVPIVKKQTEVFIDQFPIYIHRTDQELFSLTSRYPLLKEVFPELKYQEDIPAPVPENTVNLKNSPSMLLLQQLFGAEEEAAGIKNVNQILEALGGISRRIVSGTSTFLLSLLFSFLIVLDLPRLTRSVTELENTNLRFIYVEVAGNIGGFAHILGKALEAQFIIAVVNALLTAAGIYFIGLGTNVAFLSVIVFFCSFIPVVGVFISSVPICLIALQTFGVHTMLIAILLIVIIHLIEGYILNPRIYGSYMRINPVIILIVLTIGGKLFHIWGLILGVPICTYLFGHAIKKRIQIDMVNDPHEDQEIDGVSIGEKGESG